VKNIKIKNLLLFAMVTLLCGIQTHARSKGQKEKIAGVAGGGVAAVGGVGSMGYLVNHAAHAEKNAADDEKKIKMMIQWRKENPLYYNYAKSEIDIDEISVEELQKHIDDAARNRDSLNNFTGDVNQVEDDKDPEHIQYPYDDNESSFAANEKNKSDTTQTTGRGGQQEVAPKGPTGTTSAQPSDVVLTGAKAGTKGAAAEGSDGFSLLGVATDA